MTSSRPARFVGALATALMLFSFIPAIAQTLDVVPVPANGEAPTIPHLAYEGRPVRLKAIARTTGGSVYYRWDADGDGTWDVDATTSPAYSGNWYVSSDHDLDFVWNPPTTGVHHLYAPMIETSLSMAPGSSVYASTSLWTAANLPAPAGDPNWATGADDWQLQVMSGVALDEALWHLHCNLVRSGSGHNQITGWANTGAQARDVLTNSALHLLALLRRGYLPAYPPGTYETLGVTPPAGFIAANDQRWQTSAYAEDALRLMNYLLQNLTTTQSVAAADEGDDGLTPITGTNDGYGWQTISSLYEYSPGQALSLAALADCGLAGTVAQTGSLARGNTMEFVVQQMVDYVVAAQYDANSGPTAVGAWGYNPCIDCGASSDYAYGQHFGWAVYALHEAESGMGGAGVIVNDLVKNRLPNMLVNNQFTDGGPRYKTSGSYSTYSLFEPVGHFLLACRWLGWDQWDPSDSTTEAYPYLAMTRGQFRQVHDAYLNFAAARWTQSGSGNLGDTNTVLWQDGDYSSHVTGHTWFLALLSTVHGSQPGDSFGAHDWVREFCIDLVQQQRTATGAFNPWYQSSHYTNSYIGTFGQTALAALILSDPATAPDTDAPAAPATFAVDYNSGINHLNWSASASSDAAEYSLYRSDSLPVPVDMGHWICTTGGTSWTDSQYPDWDDHYVLVATDIAGNTCAPVSPTQITAIESPPRRSAIVGVHPNPFNPRVTIAFRLAAATRPRVEIFDLSGRFVARLIEGDLPEGEHEVVWRGVDDSGRTVPAGAYACRLTVDGLVESRKLMLVR